jgi:hypothetical protein
VSETALAHRTGPNQEAIIEASLFLVGAGFSFSEDHEIPHARYR